MDPNDAPGWGGVSVRYSKNDPKQLQYTNMFKSTAHRLAGDPDQLREKLLRYGKGKWDNIEEEATRVHIRQLVPHMIHAFEHYQESHDGD